MAKERQQEASGYHRHHPKWTTGKDKGRGKPLPGRERVETMLEKDQRQPLYHLTPEAGGIIILIMILVLVMMSILILIIMIVIIKCLLLFSVSFFRNQNMVAD